MTYSADRSIGSSTSSKGGDLGMTEGRGIRCLELGRLMYDDSFVGETILATVLLVIHSKLLVRSFFGFTFLVIVTRTNVGARNLDRKMK